MAKTTSQIIAENKKKRAEEAAIEASRNAIHQRQMAEVGAKSAAKTAAVLNAAGIKTKTNPNTYEVSVVGTTSGTSKRDRQTAQRLDMQKKKEDRLDAKTTVDSAQIKKDRTQKGYEDYLKSEEYKKNNPYGKDPVAGAHIPGRNNPQEKNVKEQYLREAMERAEEEFNAGESRKVREKDVADIAAMDEDDKAQLEQYAVNQIRDQNLPVEMVGMMPTAREEAGDLMAKIGGKRADELAETYMRQENENLAKAAEETGRQLAQKKPGLASAATIPVNLMGAIAGTVGQLQGAARRTGRYTTLDPNETGTALQKFSDAARGQVAQNIEGEDPNLLRKGASALYQGGMSVLDSTARMLASGGSSGIASVIAAMGGFSSALQKYSAMGASPEKAAMAATASAGLEYITEKLPTDEVLKLFHKGGKDTGVVKNILKQAFLVEPATEEVNLFAGIAAEALFLGDKSSRAQRIGDLISGGMTREEAEKQFWKETWAEAAQTYAVSGFAGLFGAGGAAIAGNQMQAAQQQRQGEAAAPFAPGVQPAAVPEDTAQPTETAAKSWQEQLQQAQEALPGMTPKQEQTQSEAIREALQRDPETPWSENEEAAFQQQRTETLQEEDAPPPAQVQYSGGPESGPDNPMMDRNWHSVGDRKVKAYMYENPEVKPFFQMEAQNMLMELSDTTKGERYYNEDVHYASGGEQGFGGVKRSTSAGIASLLDSGISYEQIERGLNAIIQDNGAENNAVSKRIEFILNDRLMNGYNDFYSSGRVPASQDYLNLINEKQITAYSQEAFDALVAEGDRYAPPENPDSVSAADSQKQSTEEGQTVPTASAKTGPDYRNSNTYMNTGLHSENANIRKGYRQELKADPNAARYAVKHNADSLAEARSRTGSTEKNAAAQEDLLGKDHWTAEDVATSTLLLDEIMASGDADAISWLNALRQKRKEIGVGAGQVSQAFSIHNETMRSADSPATAVDTFRKRLEGMQQEETTYSRASGVDFDTWKENIGQEADRIGIAIATVEEGDSNGMRQIIRQIAKARKTTAWFGTSDNLTGAAWNILKKLEFEDLKKIANTQLVAMADDFRARSTGEVVGGIRKQSMLSSLKTFVRNISGNTVGGFADAVSESGAGRILDAVLSKYTGKRTVGNDLARAGTYAKAAKEAGQFASLCVELNIPIETDVDASFDAASGTGGNEKYMGRTFRATGNPAMRALYAYQKYMSYALEVTDKVFEGGSNAAVQESLNRLKGSNLSDQDMEKLGAFTANKRTFKNATWEEGGKTKGSAMARKGAELKNATGIVGEVAMPYVNVPMNVAQTGIDYTAGVAKGLGEMISIIKDAKAGKTIQVERQRQAASDFGRGVTGTAMIGLFASAAAMGALKVSDSGDWDKEALAQAEGRSGAQINWSALLRGMNGESADWQSGDMISGLDFLEPFNTQMYLGAELAQAEDFNLLTYAGSTVKSVWQSLMDSPVMTGLSDIEQTLKDISEAETVDDGLNVAAGYGGDVASSFIPQFVRQAAQNQDGYYRDTRGATAAESAMNSIKAAIPGLSQTLPKKYSGLGEVQERGSAMETFLDPTATKEFQKNEVTTFLDELDSRLQAQNLEVDIYPDRQAPMKITVADREVQLDGAQRETYQKTYGEQVNSLYSQLMENPDFQTFSDELKAKALKEAEGYARKQAMAAVSDYRDAPTGSAEELAKGIVNSQVRSQISGLFTDLETQQEYGYSTEETAKTMEDAYQAFTDLSPKTQKEILDQAVGDTAKYLEVRQKGVETEQFLKAAQNVDNVQGTGKNGSVRDIDKRQAIAKTGGMSQSEIDIVMKAYMGDYDPNDSSSDKTELKYDYIRQELGLSPAAYAATYRAHLDNSKKKDKIAAIMAMGYDRKTATTLYNIYAGNAKGKVLYMP